MKKIDKLIKRAKNLLTGIITDIYPSNDDGFINALGVEPELYAVQLPNGTVGYDAMKVLNDTALIDWADELW